MLVTNIWSLIGVVLIGIGIILTIMVEGQIGPRLILLGILIRVSKEIINNLFVTRNSPGKKQAYQKLAAVALLIFVISFLVSLKREWEPFSLFLYRLGIGIFVAGIVWYFISDRNRK